MSTPAHVTAAIETALLSRGGTRTGDELAALCPFHDEQKPSFSYNVVKGVFLCQACGAKGGWKKLAQVLGVEMSKPKRGRPPGSTTSEQHIVAQYDYRDEARNLLFQTVRFDPKDFRQRRPDGRGWVWNLDGVRRVPYRLPELLESAASNQLVFLVEGEKDVETLRSQGLTATCNAMGAGKWRSEYAEFLRGRRVVVLADNDDSGRQHAAAVAAALFGVAASVAVLELPGPMAHGGDVSDWLGVVGTVEQLVAMAESARPLQRVSVTEVREVFGRWLHMPDPAPLYVLLGAVVANRLEGDPVWPMFVGAPGSGKTELLGSLSRLPDVHQVGTLTEASLLSGTPAREKAVDAKGGLLRELGAFGILVAKDFTTTLNLPRDTRASVLAALREIYDGHWTRRIGSDGGRVLNWQGKVALFTGCTPSIDSHHAVVSAMGERFIFVRLPIEDATAQGLRALDHVDSEQSMRAELAETVAQFFSTLTIPTARRALTVAEKRRVVALVSLAVRCRSAVERDGYHREIQLVPDPEAPTRLALILARLMTGMRLVGVSDSEVWRVAVKVALDSMPQLRRVVFELLKDSANPLDTTTIATAIAYPTQTTRRACEDLTAHGVVERLPGGEGKADRWQLTDWTRERLASATVPEMSEPEHENANGKGFPEKAEAADRQSASSDSYIYSNTVERDFPGKVTSADQVEQTDWEPSADEDARTDPTAPRADDAAHNDTATWADRVSTLDWLARRGWPALDVGGQLVAGQPAWRRWVTATGRGTLLSVRDALTVS